MLECILIGMVWHSAESYGHMIHFNIFGIIETDKMQFADYQIDFRRNRMDRPVLI